VRLASKAAKTPAGPPPITTILRAAFSAIATAHPLLYLPLYGASQKSSRAPSPTIPDIANLAREDATRRLELIGADALAKRFKG
jgi:hypothetical protein